MKRILLPCLVVALTATVHADDGVPQAPVSMDPTDARNPISIIEGGGVKVGEGTVVHPEVGLETGLVSNVFYDSADATASAVMRLLVEAGMGTLPTSRMQDPGQLAQSTSGQPMVSHGSYMYEADAYLTWDQYLSSKSDVTSQGGLGGGLLYRGIVRPDQPVSFSWMENFNRVLRPTNFESSSNTDRDINTLVARLNYQPFGRNIGGYLHYTNTLDLFEADSQQFADRFDNTLGVRVNYRWLPFTLVYADVSEGIFGGIGSSSTKVTSYPLTAVVGLQTALTVKTALLARIGYQQGFYASGPDYSSVVGGLQFTYNYSPLGKITALYNYFHEDSINANFFRDHLFQLYTERVFAPFSLYAMGQVRLREYQGVTNPPIPIMGTPDPTRDDVIVAATAGARYQFRDWLAATLYYQVSSDQTDYRYDVGGGLMDNPSYTQHVVLLGARAAY